tara:strand:+ start:685 stop:939 length:255 start_codon:yes stop_codon:yes gene_type:complete
MPQGPGTYGSQKGRPPKAMKGMKVLKKGGKVKLQFLKDKKSVEAPKGFHWMLDQGRYYLMKGDYKPHAGAVPKADFRLVNHKKS